MKKIFLITALLVFTIILISFKRTGRNSDYSYAYLSACSSFESKQVELLKCISNSDLNLSADRDKIKTCIEEARKEMKGLDFWFRYLDPIQYKSVNGPLPVEWETEVFEKYEKPYKRIGSGLTLAQLYFDEDKLDKEVLKNYIETSIKATKMFTRDSLVSELKSPDHFFFCNRLYLLNLSSIYTTGFECPDTSRIIKELQSMMEKVEGIYSTYNRAFPESPLPESFLQKYNTAVEFVKAQPSNYSEFDHFTFVRDFVNPLFSMNQNCILDYKVESKSVVDYSLNDQANSIFAKNLYVGQNTLGIFSRIKDERVIEEISMLGKLLFYDPILSGNNSRSCASCHNPQMHFTDTTVASAIQYDHKTHLSRNTPTLIDASLNHLIMMDGKHISLQDQTKAVISNPMEMGGNLEEVLQKVLSCSEYETRFKKLLKYTPQEKEITIDHIVSAITLYYGKFSNSNAAFDDAMQKKVVLAEGSKAGFNLFMSRSQCGTCHFLPQFNGVKPPFVGSEFEVLGVPVDTLYKELDGDKGRFEINPAVETAHAFRTGSIRNASNTKPYMHNGVFSSLLQVIDFYDAGGGAGRGILVENQTLSSDSLHLSKQDKLNLMEFISSLNEAVKIEDPPVGLPKSSVKKLNDRKVGGLY